MAALFVVAISDDVVGMSDDTAAVVAVVPQVVTSDDVAVMS